MAADTRGGGEREGRFEARRNHPMREPHFTGNGVNRERSPSRLQAEKP